MKKNLYLEKIGVRRKNLIPNYFTGDKKSRRKWKKERQKYGFDERDTWVLNKVFVEWLYSHLKMYLHKVENIIDLTYYKYKFEGKTYTQEEAIKYIIKCCKYFILATDTHIPKKYKKGKKYSEENAYKKMEKAIRLFSKAFGNMWW